MVSWAHASQLPETESRSVQPFLQGSRTWPTNRQTDRPCYSVYSNRLHLAIAAMRPRKYEENAMTVKMWEIEKETNVWEGNCVTTERRRDQRCLQHYCSRCDRNDEAKDFNEWSVVREPETVREKYDKGSVKIIITKRHSLECKPPPRYTEIGTVSLPMSCRCVRIHRLTMT